VDNPPGSAADGPVYHRSAERGADQAGMAAGDPAALPRPADGVVLRADLLAMVGSPGLADKSWVTEVTVPDSLRASYRAFMDAEWYRLSLPAELGGTQAPRSLTWAMAELILGSNPAIWMYASGHTMGRVLWELGTPEQKRFAELAIEREWGGTMVLTEPDAGSDVGAGRTKIIEDARMMVGTKAIATLSTGYLNALDFARTRVQGADLTQMTDKTAPRVTIIHHPDVRRMLMLQKAYAEGMRALVLHTAALQDTLQIAAAQGGSDETTAGLVDLLLPVVKGVGSERSYELLTLSLQTLGGSGFLQDYPIEQYIRDAKIDSLYEGTTGIQSLDLFFRKIIRDRGQAFGALLAKIRDFAAADGGNGRLKAERAALADAATQVEAIAAAMTGYVMASLEQPAEIYKAGLNTTRLLLTLGDLVIGWLLATHAEIALRELDQIDGASPDHDFYAGKLAAARFFAATVLPRLAAERKVAEETTLDLMDLPEGGF